VSAATNPSAETYVTDEILRKIVLEMDDGIIAIDASSTILFCNRSAEALFLARQGSLVGKSLDCLLPPRFRRMHTHYLQDFRDGAVDARYMGSRRASIVGLRTDGTEVHLGATILRTSGPNGPVFIAVMRDLTERLNHQSALERLANTDPLSGIYNRRAFTSLAKEELLRSRQAGMPASIVLFDLDHFKSVNDNHGHDVGDTVICEFTNLMKPALHSGDIVARWGGEEFIALMPNTSLDRATAIAEMVRQRFELVGFALERGQSLRLTASAGVVCCEDSRDDLESMIKHADRALYVAKSGGRNCVAHAPPLTDLAGYTVTHTPMRA